MERKWNVIIIDADPILQMNVRAIKIMNGDVNDDRRKYKEAQERKRINPEKIRRVMYPANSGINNKKI